MYIYAVFELCGVAHACRVCLHGLIKPAFDSGGSILCGAAHALIVWCCTVLLATVAVLHCYFMRFCIVRFCTAERSAERCLRWCGAARRFAGFG